LTPTEFLPCNRNRNSRARLWGKTPIYYPSEEETFSEFVERFWSFSSINVAWLSSETAAKQSKILLLQIAKAMMLFHRFCRQLLQITL